MLAEVDQRAVILRVNREISLSSSTMAILNIKLCLPGCAEGIGRGEEILS
jgi:hypothetical protein